MSDPTPEPTSRLRLRITPHAETALRAGHPWLYAEAIREQNRPGEPGELAVIYDQKNRFLGIGLFDPGSPIRARLVYLGKPRPLDTDWWRGHLEEAVDRRRGLFGEDTTGYRLINGESDGWPGLVLDRYGASLVLKLYTAAWLSRLAELTALVNDGIPNERIVLRLSRNVKPAGDIADGTVISGAPVEDRVQFLENGIKFEAEVLHGQKTGFFLDQRENRALVETLSRGREVLNAFSFSGGFSLYAARGGATSVTDIDISTHALESAQRNMALNRSHPAVRTCRHEAIQADVFDWLRDAPPRQFDLAILDPPSLARREAQRTEALGAYGRLARHGIARLRKGGVLVAASCSAHVSAAEFFSTIRRTARASRRPFQELRTKGHPPDHPATIPEAEYLKCIYLRMD